jgi:hypothetical protein
MTEEEVRTLVVQIHGLIEGPTSQSGLALGPDRRPAIYMPHGERGVIVVGAGSDEIVYSIMDFLARARLDPRSGGEIWLRADGTRLASFRTTGGIRVISAPGPSDPQFVASLIRAHSWETKWEALQPGHIFADAFSPWAAAEPHIFKYQLASETIKQASEKTEAASKEIEGTEEDWEQVRAETLRILRAEMLDTPEQHLTFVRNQLKSVVEHGMGPR